MSVRVEFMELGALLRGVSTREYAEVLPEMAETAGVSRSSVSRQAIEGSVEQLRQLRERPLLAGDGRTATRSVLCTGASAWRVVPIGFHTLPGVGRHD